MIIIESEKIPIKSWCNNPEQGALQQAKNLANLPFAFKHIALMPDTHEGFGMPIGGVLAAIGHVVPNAVGVDIGCGMCAVRSSLEFVQLDSLKKVVEQLQRMIPLGHSHNKQPCEEDCMPSAIIDSRRDYPVVYEEYESARRQIGSLGGGNHFLEVQRGSDSRIWIMLHSGSRNLGKKVADFHNKIARNLNEKLPSPIPSSWSLNALPYDSEEGQRYLGEMNYCLDFARLNRMLMLERFQTVFAESVPEVEFDQPINIHHNYAALEEHFGEQVVVHRKGATSARDQQLGIIPGSQGSKSYIVSGKGNPESFMSCSHGAGRKMGRKQAIRELDLGREVKQMERKGILHAVHSRNALDEAPGAYKDIDTVMKEQEDLVDIVVRLEPLAVVKG